MKGDRVIGHQAVQPVTNVNQQVVGGVGLHQKNRILRNSAAGAVCDDFPVRQRNGEKGEVGLVRAASSGHCPSRD